MTVWVCAVCQSLNGNATHHPLIYLNPAEAAVASSLGISQPLTPKQHSHRAGSLAGLFSVFIIEGGLDCRQLVTLLSCIWQSSSANHSCLVVLDCLVKETVLCVTRKIGNSPTREPARPPRSPRSAACLSVGHFSHERFLLLLLLLLEQFAETVEKACLPGCCLPAAGFVLSQQCWKRRNIRRINISTHVNRIGCGTVAEQLGSRFKTCTRYSFSCCGL